MEEHNHSPSHQPQHGQTQHGQHGQHDKRAAQGGTREQHVRAGHLGGVAPHKCRGRGCTKKASHNSSENQ